jgi:tRNA A37 threonylcarbamoyltransferase TsaD
MKWLGLIELTKRLLEAVTQGEDMSKEQIVSDVVAEIQAGVVQLYTEKVGEAIDKAMAEVPVGGGDPSKIYSQEELDAAVQAKADADAAADVQLKADFDALVAKEQIEADKIEKMKALLFP